MGARPAAGHCFKHCLVAIRSVEKRRKDSGNGRALILFPSCSTSLNGAAVVLYSRRSGRGGALGGREEAVGEDVNGHQAVHVHAVAQEHRRSVRVRHLKPRGAPTT